MRGVSQKSDKLFLWPGVIKRKKKNSLTFFFFFSNLRLQWNIFHHPQQDIILHATKKLVRKIRMPPILWGTCWALCPSEDQLLSMSFGAHWEVSGLSLGPRCRGLACCFQRSAVALTLNLDAPPYWTTLRTPWGAVKWVNGLQQQLQVPITKYFNTANFRFYFISGSKTCLPKRRVPRLSAWHSAGSPPSGHNLPWRPDFPQPSFQL